ncbi:MAG: 50S ribosomal protein L18 [Chloroflexi bacterium]|nr:50S ribosomal protein L18 [Chloroflexota bacterium]
MKIIRKKGDLRIARAIRHKRVRAKVSGTGSRPRLNVFRSLNHIYGQIIDDEEGRTLLTVSTLDKEVKEKVASLPKKDQSQLVGKVIAQRALEKGISAVVFDRGGYRYHGRVRSLAEGAREGGLKF